MERRIIMPVKPNIIPVEGIGRPIPIQTLPPNDVAPLPAPLPVGLPASGVFDSLFSGLPGGAFIGRYWWILILVFFLFMKPGVGRSTPRAPFNGGILLIVLLLFLLYPQFISKLGFRR